MEKQLVEAISSLQQNPSFISKLFVTFSSSDTYKLHQAYSFWKWSALILAMVASFTTIIKRLKSLIFRLHNRRLLSSSPPILTDADHRYFSDNEVSEIEIESDIDTDTSSSCSVSEEYNHEKENDDVGDEDFSVKGSSYYNDDDVSKTGQCFSWLEFTTGKNSVVKLWDNINLGLNDVVSFNNTATSSSTPTLVLTAGVNSLKVWDTRSGRRRIPEILAEWKPRLGRIVGLNAAAGCGEKLFVRDDVDGEVTVADTRNVSSPLVNVTECDATVETWWDADAVILTDECVGQSRRVCDGESILRRRSRSPRIY